MRTRASGGRSGRCCLIASGFWVIAQSDLDLQLISSGRIKGDVVGKRFIPDTFVQAQKHAIKDFFQSNGRISWGRVEALQVIRRARTPARSHCAPLRLPSLATRRASSSAGRRQRSPLSPSGRCSPPTLWRSAAALSRPHSFRSRDLTVPLPLRELTRWSQKLESDVAAELTTKHCVDIGAFVPDEFAADTDALAQRMPQVLPPRTPPQPSLTRATLAGCSCLWTATCCSSQVTAVTPMATPMLLLLFFSRARGSTASAT
jgi:hypothetical protein